MNWKSKVTGVALLGCLLFWCGCVNTVTSQYYSFRANRLYEADQKRQAFDLYFQSAQNGLAESQYTVAQMLLFGDGIQADTAEGMQWLEKAATQDHPEAARDLAVYLLNGEFDRKRDPQQAVRYLESAAAGGDSLAMLVLGQVYLTGSGAARNPETAAYWYGEAAQHGEWVPLEWQNPQFLSQAGTPRPISEKQERRNRVKRAQTGLRALGYYKGRVDGIDGPGTAAAVRNFQKDRGVDVNGRINVVLMRHLYGRIVFDPMQRRM
ncbi:MAG: peptidoglycan-binding protein [Desulfobacterales bacterium]